MEEKIERKRLAILRVLNEEQNVLSSQKITKMLSAVGVSISERTVRFHLQTMDKLGLTEYIGKQGRRITSKGVDELSNARIHEKIGFLTAKIDHYTYSMSFDLSKKKGTVVINVSLIEKSKILELWPLMKRVYSAGYSMGQKLALFKAGERVGDVLIPKEYVGVGTVCSITLNGVLLEYGIPVNSKFGGLLELEDGEARRFVEIIYYNGTTLDPLEVFIKSGMTDYLGATATGSGLIGASFREVPAACRDKLVWLQKELLKVGLGGFLELGWPGQALRGVPVNEGALGAIVIGGLNPAAILEESGYKISSTALSGLVEYDKLIHYSDIEKALKKII